jgi:hypothetical protein
MCLQCEPYRPGREDTVTTTEQDAARFERQRYEDLYGGDDVPDQSEYLE